ncbi:MAG: serine peptidase [Gammaproteobacteria bacterium]|nr:MAG: serine peptidase [Gammaproteobacteria bacterium]
MTPFSKRAYKSALILTACLFSASFAAELPDFTALIKKNAPTVVQIDARSHASPTSEAMTPEELLRYFYEGRNSRSPQQQLPTSSHGSGFIIDSAGYILTNAHVIKNTDEITVSTTDQTEYQAKLIGVDERTDVALLKIDKTGLPAAKIGDSDKAEVGNWVLAIGSPFGFDYTATKGIISAVSRSLPDGTYVPFIQTDAAVNPGNSGGPLFNLDGEVIGINSQIYSRTGTFNGLAFAIPINTAMNVANQLKEKGFVSRGWLGVLIQGVDQDLAQSFGLKVPRGALITRVLPDSPAEQAGLLAGDIVLSLNDKQIKKSNELPPIVGAIKVGTSVNAQVLRQGKEKQLTITIGELKDGNPMQVSTQIAQHGLKVADLSDKQKATLALDSGVIVTEVLDHSRAKKVGFRVGDIIVNVNNHAIDNAKAFRQAMNDIPADMPVAVLVIREGRSLFIPL